MHSLGSSAEKPPPNVEFQPATPQAKPLLEGETSLQLLVQFLYPVIEDRDQFWKDP